MNILGIETATAVCAAALAVDGTILHGESIEAQQVHAEKLLVLIDAVLHKGGIGRADIDGIAVSIGPGSFTGLRIGLSAAKGLAMALGKPLLAVPTLEATALNVVRRENLEEGAIILPAIESRRDEVFTALYRLNNGVFREELGPSALSVAYATALAVQYKNVVLAGNGAERIQTALEREGKNAAGVRMPPREHRQCDAGAIALLGAQRLQQNKIADLASAEPLYIKEFYTTAKPVHNSV